MTTNYTPVVKPLSGRWNTRCLNSNAKLSVRDVYAIRRLWREMAPTSCDRVCWQELADQFCVSIYTVRDIVERSAWVRLPPELVYWKPEPPSAFCSWWITIWIFLQLCAIDAQHQGRQPSVRIA
jgi:hypothetical protein